MWLIRRNGRTFHHYSIAEKIAYYQNILNSSESTKEIERATRNLYRLNRIANGKETFGKVFMVKDTEFNPYANSGKSRRVVCIGVKDGNMKVLSVRKNNKMVFLSKFDGNRGININHAHDISLDKIYEKSNFSKTSNDYLTLKEKLELYRKLNNR